MQKVSIRLPGSVVRAYDEANGTRSALMRRRLTEAIENGELTGVPDDLQVLAEREGAVDRGELARKRGTFKQRCYDYFQDKWESGAVTPDDADDLAESWRDEAALYGSDEHLAFTEAVIEWYRQNWKPQGRRGFPDPGHFVVEADPESNRAQARLVDVLSGFADEGVERSTAVQQLADSYDTKDVFDAAAEVWDHD